MYKYIYLKKHKWCIYFIIIYYIYKCIYHKNKTKINKKTGKPRTAVQSIDPQTKSNVCQQRLFVKLLLIIIC